MMESFISAITALFAAANSLTPLAILGLLVVVIYVQHFRQPNKQELALIKDNHLHDLPTIASNTSVMAENTALMAESLRRIEHQQIEKFAIILGKLEKK